MKRALVLVLVCGVTVAQAGPQQVLVLRSDGNADTSSRTSIDTHVLRLAKHIDGNVDAGDITLQEAAAVVGCNIVDAGCKDEVLTTMGVDEMIATTVSASPTGLTVTVRRLSKGTVPRAAQTVIPVGKAPDAKLNADIGPLFGIGLATTPLVERGTTTTPTPTPAPTPPTTAPPPTVADPSTAPTSDNNVTAAPTGVVAEPPAEGNGTRNRRIQKIGMGAGGAFVLLGFLMWSQTTDKQEEIDNAPANSPADFVRLRELEEKADDIAGAGNLFFLVGLAVGGVSGYYFWKGSRAKSQTATVAPAVYPNGAGVTLTIGGAR